MVPNYELVNNRLVGLKHSGIETASRRQMVLDDWIGHDEDQTGESLPARPSIGTW